MPIEYVRDEQTLSGNANMYVYFVGTRGSMSSLVKIGKANDPAVRLTQLQTGSPLPLYIIGSVRCRNPDHALQVERLAHNLFWKQRRRGEWFSLRRAQIDQIHSLIKKTAAA